MLSHGLNSLGSGDFANFWHGNLFYPFAYTMALSDTLIVPVILSLPFEILGIDRFVIYNASIPVFFVGFGLACFALARNLTGGRGCLSFLGAILASVNFFWFRHIGHYQLLGTYWYPLILLLWLRYYQTRMGLPGASWDWRCKARICSCYLFPHP